MCHIYYIQSVWKNFRYYLSYLNSILILKSILIQQKTQKKKIIWACPYGSGYTLQCSVGENEVFSFQLVFSTFVVYCYPKPGFPAFHFHCYPSRSVTEPSSYNLIIIGFINLYINVIQ